MSSLKSSVSYTTLFNILNKAFNENIDRYNKSNINEFYNNFIEEYYTAIFYSDNSNVYQNMIKKIF